MSQEQPGSTFRTLILMIIIVPLVGYLIYFSIKKSSESESRARQCQEQCTEQGYPGHDFKWGAFSGPVCSCLGEPQK